MMLKTCQYRNKRAIDAMLTMIVLLILAFIVFLYLGYMGGFSSHFKNQNYNEFACTYMRENKESLSINERLWVTGFKSLKASPLETALGVAPCGREFQLVTNNTGNITELILNYSRQACEYGENNTFEQFTWARSLPVNVTDGNISYNTIAPSGPPGVNPCYLIWRINTSYITSKDISTKYLQTIATTYTMYGGFWLIPYVDDALLNSLVTDVRSALSSAENDLKNGTIMANTTTTLRIDYMGVIKSGNRANVSIIEVWGVPSG